MATVVLRFPRVVGPITLLVLSLTGVTSIPASAAVRAESPAAFASALDFGCPSGPHPPRGIHVWIRVVKWCGVSAVRGQVQLKVQVQIHNSGRRTLDISRGHLRLIVTPFARTKWSPPRNGPPTTDRPFKTTYAGRRVWAIPPNADAAADPIPHKSREFTFATHWGGSRLGPGQTFRPHHHYGDLVFFLPSTSFGARAGKSVLGLAYVDGRDIIVLCPEKGWPDPVPAADW
jgi:hypothetical protein